MNVGKGRARDDRPVRLCPGTVDGSSAGTHFFRAAKREGKIRE